MTTTRTIRGSARGRTRARSTGMTQSPGWLRPDSIETAETVVALFRRDRLPEGLSALHARGMGHTARVLDPARGPVADQLVRAGIAADLGLPELSGDDVLLLVAATGRSAIVGDLLLDNRAREVRVYRPGGEARVADPIETVTGVDPVADAAQ
jgi:hypothetical protein